MRESINGAWLLGIMMVFICIFIAYVSIQINYSKAYKVKTNMVTIIEQYDGVNPTSIMKMQENMMGNGYESNARCSTDKGGFVGINTREHSNTNPSGWGVCVYREYRPHTDFSEEKYYYTVETFFGFDLPMLGDLYTFRVSGETNAIYYPNDTFF